MFSFARVCMFIQVCPVKLNQPVPVFRKMRRNPVHNHADIRLVEFVNHISEVVGRTETRCRRKQPRNLISPRPVKRVFAYRQKFNVRKAHVHHIRHQRIGQLAIGQKFRNVFPFSAPRTEMNFINARRTVKAVISFAILHPLPVIPLVVVEVINDRRRLRAYFGIKCHRVAFRQNIAFLRFNFILIEFALADIRNKDIPYAAVIMFAHNVDAAVPVVKCTDNRYPFRVRRPNRKADAFHPVDFHQVCTQFFIKIQMVAFRKQILVYIAQNRRE